MYSDLLTLAFRLFVVFASFEIVILLRKLQVNVSSNSNLLIKKNEMEVEKIQIVLENEETKEQFYLPYKPRRDVFLFRGLENILDLYEVNYKGVIIYHDGLDKVVGGEKSTLNVKVSNKDYAKFADSVNNGDWDEN